MKKHKFSEKLPEVGKTIICKVLRESKFSTKYGVFNTFFIDRGIKLEADFDFIDGDICSVTTIIIYHDAEIPAELIWWADPEEEE